MSKAAKKVAKKLDGRKNRGRVPGSVAERIDNLSVNESYAESVRFNIDKVKHEAILEALKAKRSALAAYVARVTDELDTREYRVESGTYITDDRSALICNVTVTRVE